MSEFIKNAKRFIKSLENRKSIDNFSAYYGSQDLFNYYVNATGFLNDKYFQVNIWESEERQVIDFSEKCTDCIEEIKLIAKKYNLIN